MSILPANPKANYLSFRSEIDEAVARVLESGYYLMGEQTALLEEEFAAHVGVAHGVGVASGTDALHLALRAAGVGAGSEVITVSHTAVATVAAIELAGAEPVFVDVDPFYYTMDPVQLDEVVTSRTKAILPVHLYGHPAPMEEIVACAQQHDLFIIEDCAQSHGAAIGDRMTGSWGHLAAFSFYPTKNLSALGDGGMIVTNDATLAQKVRHLQQYGWKERYISEMPGLNSRLDEIQAAILRVKLNHLSQDNRKRTAIAQKYTEGLAGSGVDTPNVGNQVSHVFHQYVIRTEQRDELRKQLRADDIVTLIHYPVPVHEQPAYRGRISLPVPLPHTEAIARQILSLPIYPELTTDEVDAVIGAIAAQR